MASSSSPARGGTPRNFTANYDAINFPREKKLAGGVCVCGCVCYILLFSVKAIKKIMLENFV